MSNFIDAQERIKLEIEALAADMKFSVFPGSLPTGEELKEVNGRYWPYVVYSFGGKTEVANKHRGITSSAEDVKWTALVFFCVGDTPWTVWRLKDALRTKFEGYVPEVGWGEYTEVLTGDFGISKPDPDLIPLRYGETLAFSNMTN